MNGSILQHRSAHLHSYRMDWRHDGLPDTSQYSILRSTCKEHSKQDPYLSLTTIPCKIHIRNISVQMCTSSTSALPTIAPIILVNSPMNKRDNSKALQLLGCDPSKDKAMRMLGMSENQFQQSRCQPQTEASLMRSIINS